LIVATNAGYSVEMPSVSRVASSALVALVTIVLHCSSARAQASKPQDLHVLEIDSEDADDQAEALTGGLRSRVRSTPGWVLPETSQSLRMLTAALRCPQRPDAACLVRIGDHLKADRFVWGTLSKAAGHQVTADMHLWTRGKPDVAIHETYSDNLKDQNDDTLRKIATRILDRLAGGLAVAASQNAVVAVGPSADVAVEPEPAHDAPSPPSDAPPPHGSARAALGWTGVVAGSALLVAGGTLGVVFETSRAKLNTDRQNNYGNVSEGATIDNPCDPPPGESNSETSAGCNAHTVAHAVLIPEIATLGAGAVLAVVGIVLLATEPKHAPSTDAALGLRHVKLLPQFETRGASLRLSAAF
jgi:hypothetical protein